MPSGYRGGRPAVTTAHELSAVALRLFVDRGYDETSVDDVAAAAGISRRTFFRYFPAKADVLFVETPAEVERLRLALASADPGESVRTALRRAVLLALEIPAGQDEWVRQRAALLLGVPALHAYAHSTFDTWRAVASADAAMRLDCPAGSVVPIVVGHAALAASVAAHEYWITSTDGTLPEALAAALDLLIPDV